MTVLNEDPDFWDHNHIALPPRSRLFHLEPAGLGTSFIESLASYSARLAAAHSVTHASLFGHEIAPLIDRKYLRNSESKLDKGAFLTASFGTLARSVNGTGVTARDYAGALEKLTGRNNLHHLTMATWTNVIPSRNLLKPTKAWCPACYEEFKLNETTVFEPLLWSLAVITCCPRHLLRLRTRCHLCARTLPQLDSHSRPGFCSKCNGWLGQSAADQARRVEDITDEELEWQIWVIKQLDNLLAATPKIGHTPEKKALTESIKFCIKNLAHMTESCFARSIGVPQSTVSDWQRQGKSPELERLLRIAYLTQTPLINILQGTILSHCILNDDMASAGKHKGPVELPRTYKQRTRINIKKARAALEAALTDEITPSVEEVARNLSCSSTPLKDYFPILCKKLSEKYKQRRKAERGKIEIALKEALVQDPPQPIRIIAKELKRNHTSLYNYFPEMCRQLARRYDLYRRACRGQKKATFQQEIRDVVIALHQEGVYPSVKRVESRLSTHKTLRFSKMALETLREIRAELGIAMRHNNFARVEI